MSKNSILFLAQLATVVAFTGAARAQVITVPNPDLEGPGWGNSSDPNRITYFVESATDGHSNYGDAGVTGPDGQTSGFINTDSDETTTLTTDLTAGGTLTAPTFVTGDIYTLQLEIGINPTNGNGDYDRTGNITFGLLSNGAVVGTQTSVPSGTIVPTISGGSPQVTFEDFTYTYTATAADNGHAIGVQINDQYGGGSQTEFSELSLTAPEPGTWAMMLGSLAALAVLLRFRAFARL